jgi:LDH2 family malate/lactate/ureidoglycolate dehydrogenase
MSVTLIQGPNQGSKITLPGGRVAVSQITVRETLEAILAKRRCAPDVALAVAAHLIDTELGGVESHGVVRIIQYAEQYESGYLRPDATIKVTAANGRALEIDGGGGIGIPAMEVAVDHCCDQALRDGLAVLALRNVGHTGRLGAFAEAGAARGCFVMIVGGGGRHNWRQVAPYGGRKAILPTNPYCFASPGGARGPVVVDFATSIIAGGWLHAARAAGGLVPEGAIIDIDGKPSRDPQAYFDGGAILPKGGAMGYGLAVMAEMLCDAMLGPATTEVNWLIVAIDTARFREPHCLQAAAEDILAEVRACPPASGVAKVEVPGERERDRRKAIGGGPIELPVNTWAAIEALAKSLGIPPL